MALKTLPDRIAKLQASLAEVELKLTDATMFTKDPGQIYFSDAKS